MTATETLERPKDKLKKKSIKKIVDQDDSPDLPKPKKVKTKKSVKKQTPTFNLKGLSKAEFEERLQKFGQNAIPEKKKIWILQFGKRFIGMVPFLLEAVAIVAFVQQNWANGAIVLALLILNAILGVFNEWRADVALQKIKQKLQVKARVLRDSQWGEVNAKELVPDDVVRIRVGDFIPADLQLALGEVSTDESALTGETAELEKHEGDELMSGSIVRKGEGTAVVIRTGMNTTHGRTMELVSSSAPKMHIESIINKVVWALMSFVIVLLIIVILIATLVNKDTFWDILPIVLVLLVSAIPVALPATFTITMAVGSMQISKKNVLITRLSSAEDISTMSVLCSDKTGTLSMNQMTLTDVLPISKGIDKRRIVLLGALSSKAENQDVIDLAFFKDITKHKEEDELKGRYEQIDFSPFTHDTRRTEAVIFDTVEKRKFRIAKGAINTMIDVCKVTDEKTLKMIHDAENEHSVAGHKSLALAVSQDLNSPLVMVGVVGISDPPRADSATTVKQLQELGITVKMLTGDAQAIGIDMATRVGIGSRILSMKKLKESQKVTKNDELKLDFNEIDGLAEVMPEDKHWVVQQLQKQGFIVGMTGDGVNDSPALKLAEVGIATANATDVAKGAASAVLTAEGLSPIVPFVTVGRQVHERMITWIINKIVKTIQQAVVVVIGFLVWRTFVVTAFEMLLMLFLIDFVTISIATDNVKAPKEPASFNIFYIMGISGVVGVASLIESLGLLFLGFYIFGLGDAVLDAPDTTTSTQFQTFAFETLFFFGQANLFVVRARDWFWSSKPSWTLLIAIGIDSIIVIICSSLGMEFADFYAIPFWQTAVILGWCLVCMVINDVMKMMFLNTRKWFAGRRSAYTYSNV